MSAKPFAEATERNSQPILGILRHEFEQVHTVLEIGSGTGQHAVCFAAALGHLSWQTSEMAEHHEGIRAWLDDAALSNVRAPIELDVRTAELPEGIYDAVFSANTAHIMGFPAVEKMFELVGRVLSEDGKFCLYGPFRQGREFNTQSNAAFHGSLRDRDPEMGIRHLEDLDRLASAAELHRQRLYGMPNNNHLVVWRKAAKEHQS